MQLYFIRHAQSQNNLLYDQNGSDNGRKPDPLLTEAGWQQAHILAEFIKSSDVAAVPVGYDPHNRAGFKFSHLYCSLMTRSIQTGTEIAKAVGLPLVALLDLHEGGGIFHKDESSNELIPLPGNDEAYFQENFPHLILPDEMNKSGWWNRPIENFQSRCERAARLLKLLLSLHADSDDRIALVSHGGFYNYFLGEILGWPRKSSLSENADQYGVFLLMNNVAISRVDWTPKEIRLVYHNRTDFLPTELIT